MGRFFRPSAPCILGVLLVSSLPTPANAQLKSFAAIGILALDPPQPGTEKPYKSLTTYLKDLSDDKKLRELQILQSPTNPELTADRAERFARCALRTDLPKPRVFGLVCRDYAGQYVGTLRAATTVQFQKTLRRMRSDDISPRARPLTQYEFVHVVSFEPIEPGLAYAASLADLLRVEGPWKVVQAPLMVPPSATDRVLKCQFYMRPDISMRFMFLKLFDSEGELVRAFYRYSSSNATKNLRDVVQELLDAWRADEEIYKPLPGGPG